MNTEKQQLLLSYLISHPDIFPRVNAILEPRYFDVQVRKAATFVKAYFEEYKGAPNAEQILAETGVKLTQKEALDPKEIKYALNEIETFCRNRSLEEAIYSAPPLIDAGEHGKVLNMVKEAVMVSMTRDLGTDYFNDPELRLKALELMRNTIPSGFIDLDEALNGGLNRKEMIIFSAPPGVGKSLTMANVMRNFLLRKLNGVYVTLELAEEVVAKRFDSMFTGIEQVEILKNITKVSTDVRNQAQSSGKLFIKRMRESTTNANHVRAYLKELEIMTGIIPDILVIDYLDLMASCEKISVENVFVKDKYVSEELRGIADEYNLVLVTASQLNRGALNADISELNQSHIAGGISKANTADNLVAIIRTEAMQAKNEFMFKLLKTRSSNGVNKKFMMDIDPKSLVLKNRTGNGNRPFVSTAPSGPSPRPSSGSNPLDHFVV